MASHRQIMVNLAEAVRQSASVLEDAKASFGRGLDIFVGAYSDCIPGVEDSPFLWIVATGESDEVATDDNFTLRAVVGGCLVSGSGEKVIVDRRYERTENANGLAVNGGNAVIEALRDKIISVALASSLGAPVVRVRKTENDLSHFPLEWAEFEVDFLTPGTINNQD